MTGLEPLPGEQWRPVPGWEGIYEVSDLGRVYSARRKGVSKSGRILRTSRARSGHLSVSLRRDGERVQAAVHRLVLAAFLGPCPDGHETRHLDGDPGNNRLDNLRYGTRRENTHDRALHRDPDRQVPRCRYGHPYDEVNTFVLSTRPTSRNCRTCLATRRRAIA